MQMSPELEQALEPCLIHEAVFKMPSKRTRQDVLVRRSREVMNPQMAQRLERRKAVRNLHGAGVSQSDIARTVGITQSNVCRIIQSFGDPVRNESLELRARGFTQKEAAAQLGVPQGTIGRWWLVE